VRASDWALWYSPARLAARPGFTDAEEVALGRQFAKEHEKNVVLLDTPCLPLT